MQPWWEREPARLCWELQQLDSQGIAYDVDESAFAEGRLVLHLCVRLPNIEPLRLVARFPAVYPYQRFEVEAPGLDLPYHQHPFQKNLCLIGRASDNWHVSDDLATFVTERVPHVLTTASATNPATVKDLEEHQAEPFSDYYPALPDAMILIDSDWQLSSEVVGGTLEIGLIPGWERKHPIRGAVLAIFDQYHQPLATAAPELRACFSGRNIQGRWIRVSSPIRCATPEEFLQQAQAHGTQFTAWGHQFGNADAQVFGVIFPEEHQWRSGGVGDGWVFLGRNAKPDQRQRKAKQGTSPYFIRAGRVGRNDLVERVPDLRNLTQHKVAVFGAGALGSASIVALARTGIGELRIIDGDFVDPATTPRWALGVSASGLTKVGALAAWLRQNTPYTKVVTCNIRLGNPQNGPKELEVLAELLSGADLVYDATAERGLQYMLSELAREQRIPYLGVEAQQGAWGGMIARILPQAGAGCWLCLMAALQDGTIPMPPHDPQGNLQPTGCANPTFTGAGFDLDEVALAGVRLAVQTLSRFTPGAYPDARWHVGVLALRDQSTGEAIPPTWSTFPLGQHPRCPTCRHQQ